MVQFLVFIFLVVSMYEFDYESEEFVWLVFDYVLDCLRNEFLLDGLMSVEEFYVLVGETIILVGFGGSEVFCCYVDYFVLVFILVDYFWYLVFVFGVLTKVVLVFDFVFGFFLFCGSIWLDGVGMVFVEN